MLHAASAPERRHAAEAAMCCWAQESNAWLVLPDGTMVGFGDGRFLGEALDTPGTQHHLVMLYLLGSTRCSPSIQIVSRAAALEILAKTGRALGAACSAQPSLFESLGYAPEHSSDARGYYLTPELITLVESGLSTTMPGRAKSVYRAAKGMELVCETLRLRAASQLAPIIGSGELSMDDSLRILAAKQVIAERFSEKLTLESIGRACGLSRGKLTRGFRDMFNSSISATIAEYRFLHARKMLARSDRPVSSIGYAAGYLNNASFARAFHRRFGLPPSEFRAMARRRVRGIDEAAMAA